MFNIISILFVLAAGAASFTSMLNAGEAVDALAWDEATYHMIMSWFFLWLSNNIISYLKGER